MSNIVTTAEQDFEAIVDKMLGHLKGLITFAGTQRDRLNTVASDVQALGDKVETDVMAKLDGFEEKIRDGIMQPIMDKIAAVEADLGAQIAALTGGTGTPTPADTVSGATVTDPASVIAGQTGATTVIAQAAIDAHAEASAAGIDPVAHATDAAVGAGADPVTAAQVAQAVSAATP